MSSFIVLPLYVINASKYPLALISVLFGPLNIILVFFKVGNNLLYGITDTLAPVSILNL